eukprot:TRINITY_DN764_c0_g1_i1.p1 TRINITY_DN764_c0_g1~~TRINITY_DN764_c0_g1_i1.p1  ORF type:complete len:171 (+),score=54.66 TRINITY_DN764_c0_g1_i1:358-870(+)
MAPIRAFGFAAAGATVAQMLPGLVMESQLSNGHAMWAWSSSPPKCKPAAGANWNFVEGATIAQGAKGTVKCTASGHTASAATVACPASAATPAKPDGGWWSTCKPGKSCVADMPIGSSISCKGGNKTTAKTTATTTTTKKAASTSGASGTAASSMTVIMAAAGLIAAFRA